MMRQSEQVTVVIADDHPMYREGVVRAMKESGRIRVVAEVGDGRAALEAIREHEPAVALLDYRMPELDGLAVVTAVARDHLPTRVLLLSATEDPSTVYEALAAGAAGYLTKESDRDEIVAAVISCAKGGGYVLGHRRRAVDGCDHANEISGRDSTVGTSDAEECFGHFGCLGRFKTGTESVVPVKIAHLQIVGVHMLAAGD